MVRYLFSLCLSALFVVFIGCSGFDSTQILLHPESAKPEATIDVALVDLFIYLASGSTIPETVERDTAFT